MNLLLAGLALAAMTTWGAVLTLPDNNLHVVVCDVGQGDGILVFKGTVQMLVDAGPGDRILDCLAKYVPFYDHQIELAVITHPQSDHFRGFAYILDRYTVSQIVSDGFDNSTSSWQELKSKMKDIPYKSVRTGDKIQLTDSVTFTIIWPSSSYASGLGLGDFDLNVVALVGKLSYGNFDVLLTADADSQVELAQLATGLLTEVDVLKVPHHGSKTGMLDEWLRVVKPQISVISVGKNNSYGHPAAKTLDQLTRVGSKTWRTDINGNVEFISDGSKWWYNLQYAN